MLLARVRTLGLIRREWLVLNPGPMVAYGWCPPQVKRIIAVRPTAVERKKTDLNGGKEEVLAD